MSVSDDTDVLKRYKQDCKLAEEVSSVERQSEHIRYYDLTELGDWSCYPSLSKIILKMGKKVLNWNIDN